MWITWLVLFRDDIVVYMEDCVWFIKCKHDFQSIADKDLWQCSENYVVFYISENKNCP